MVPTWRCLWCLKLPLVLKVDMMHVLGSKASIFATDTHARVREHILMAGGSLVLILTAVRKKRPYTDREWDEIFGPISMKYFHAIDSIKHWDNDRKVSERRQYNLTHPDSPKELNEFTCKDRDPQDSSDNSTDDDWRSFVGFFDRGQHILPHAVLHMKSQVYMGTLPVHAVCSIYLGSLPGSVTCV